MVLQTVDGIAFRMAREYDFSFLGKFGKVFKIWDDQDSGNICFGLEREGQRLFLKFAGAPTQRASCPPREAIKNLRSAAEIYRQLAHDSLICLRWAGEIGGGYATVFDWVDAVCMGKMYPQDRKRFFSLPLDALARVQEEIMAFLLHVNERGFVAVDFYDGSVLYDFARGKTVLCDIDLFLRQPCVNQMGRMWGSSRFMSPEEFTLGAPIDERTNVFLAGAMAFALLGGETDRSQAAWRASDGLYRVALRAVSADRAQRYPSLRAMQQDWAREKVRPYNGT